MAITEDLQGKLLYELQGLYAPLKNDAVFLVSQDNLTRKISFNAIKRAISNSDKDVSYYNSEQIDKLFDNVYDKIKDIEFNMQSIENDIDKLNDRIEEVRSELIKKIDGWILKGFDAPTAETCPPGRVYLQLFK